MAKAGLRSRIRLAILISSGFLFIVIMLGGVYEIQHRRIELPPTDLMPTPARNDGSIMINDVYFKPTWLEYAATDPNQNPLSAFWRSSEDTNEIFSIGITRTNSAVLTASDFLLRDQKDESVEDDGTYGPREDLGDDFGADFAYIFCQYAYTSPTVVNDAECASWKAFLVYGQYVVQMELSQDVNRPQTLDKFRTALEETTANINVKLAQ